MRFLVIIALAILGPRWTYGQGSNVWIDYNANYWTFPIATAGLYRLDYTTMLQAGMDFTNWSPDQWRLVAEGQTIPWEFIGDDDNQFEAGEYYLAYLKGNQGDTETDAYANSSWRPNRLHSLFNDTLYHYVVAQSGPNMIAPWAWPENLDVPAHNALRSTVHHGLHNTYYIGRADNNGISLASYDEAEGWYDPSFGNADYIIDMALPERHPDFNAIDVSWRVGSVNSALGIPNHHLQIGMANNQSVLWDTTFTGYRLWSRTATTNVSSSQGSVALHFKTINDLGVSSDRMAVGELSVSYQRLPIFANGESAFFEVESIGNSPWTKIEMQLANYNSPAVYATIDGQKQKLPSVITTNGLTVYIPWNNSNRLELHLVDTAIASAITALRPLEMVNYLNQASEGQLLLLTHRSLWNSAQNYSAYKQANGHSVMVVDVEQLYHQFGYGTMKSPLAIRRFLQRLVEEGATPGHVFILGKSIHEATLGGNLGARNQVELYTRNLVPTWGYPGSDVMLTSGLGDALFEPHIPIGRLAAEQPEDVLEYLNKVVEFTSQPAALWKKNILHFGGGSIASEQELFQTYLNTYQNIAQGLQVGASVHRFFKDTNEPIQLDVSDSIQYFINEGVSLMTFFGHASSTGFDQNIDAPENYSNQGKYPLLIGNSCYTGNIHLASAQSASELFVMAPNRGVIGFLAKSDLGIPTYLDMYTHNFYLNLFQSNYGQSIGQCMKSAIQAFQSANDFYKQNVAQNFSLHGDPSLVLFPHQQPDLVVDNQSIIIPTGPISAAEPTMEVRTVIENWGKATTESFEIQLTHIYPNGIDTTYIMNLQQCLRIDTLVWTIPLEGQLGQHQLRVSVDYPSNVVPELEEAVNNQSGFVGFLVTDGDIRPVYPYDFAVIDEPAPVLRASTAFAFEPLRSYRIQADTTARFDSPALVSTSVTSVGGIVEWPLPMLLQDSTVVFWRCSPDSIQEGDQWYWKNASFQYIANRRGWGQQHPDQWKQNTGQGLSYSEGAWDYETATAMLKCDVYGGADTYFENLATRYQLNLDVQEYGGYGYNQPALMVAVLDSATLVPWKSNYAGLAPEHEFGNTLVSANARARQEKYFIFQQDDPVQLEGLAAMLLTGIPAGHHVLMYSWQYAIPSLWPENLVNAMDGLGLTNLTNAADSLPFIGYWQQGQNASLNLHVGETSSDFIQMEIQLQGLDGLGKLTSPIIGPATQWGEAEWLFGSSQLQSSDQIAWMLSGGNVQPSIDVMGDSDHWLQDGIDLSVLNSNLAMAQWTFNFSDASAGTLPPLKRVHLWFTEAPEFALAANAQSYFESDTIAQGQVYRMMMPVRNVGQINGDSLLIKYLVVDAKGAVHKIAYPIQNPLLVGQEIRDTIAIPTANLPGWNTLIMDVNPLDSTTQLAHQWEEHRFNNYLEKRFYVQSDKIPPILEVTADGRHILDGEIISAQPELLITLRDENRYMLLNEWADTTHFRIYLTDPSNEIHAIRFDHPQVQVEFSNGPSAPFKIRYSPQGLSDGLYNLRVQANDKSGNQSGELDYQIHFRIINQSAISEMVNYPNPFSTSTKFVFTLTGSEVPQDIKIQIFSASGKLVREIMGYELGALHIGRNITDYAWDGRDEFGDLLANGVYLYRTIVRMHDQDLLHLETDVDQYFNRGFGKMYLLR